MEKIEIKYKKSFVAFLDVLGFKEIIKEKDLPKLDTYFNELKSIIEYLRKTINDIECIVISDSIIITVPFDEVETNNFKKLNILCDHIMLLQYHLIKNDIWIRGAISFGDTYCKDNQIVGQGYINAYLLEQEAIYPRVILDSKIIYELRCGDSLKFIKCVNSRNSNGHKIKEDRTNVIYNYKENINNHLEQDVALFINYLDYFDKNEEIEIIINYIRNNIYKNNSLYKKYKWVSNYLLSFIGNSDNPKLKKYLDEIKSL